MRTYKAYDEFLEMVGGQYEPQPADFDLTGRVDDAAWSRFVGAGLVVRDVRSLRDGCLWVRLESKSGMQVVTCWSRTGALRAWSVPLEDCGAVEGGREIYDNRTLDVWAYVREIGELGEAVRETAFPKTIRALDLFGFRDTPEHFIVDVFADTSYEIAEDLNAIIYDEARMRELTADDSREVALWKRTLLRLAAALGGVAEAQRETAWCIDPGNDSTAGFGKNLRLSAYWYEMAAKQKDGLAAHNLAVFYSGGDRIFHDCRKAIEYFGIAVRAGVPEAVEPLRRCKNCRARRKYRYGL